MDPNKSKVITQTPFKPFLYDSNLKRKAFTGKPRPKNRPQKIQANHIKQHVKSKGEARVDRKEVEPIEKIISTTKVSSKIYEQSTYKKAISNPMHFCQ